MSRHWVFGRPGGAQADLQSDGCQHDGGDHRGQQRLRREGGALVISRGDGKAVIYRLTDAKTLALMDLLGVLAALDLAPVERLLPGLSGGVDPPEPVSHAAA